MIRKINIKLLLSSLFCVLMLMLSLTNLGAVSRTPTYPKNSKFSRGVANTCYYINSTASSYTSKINKAADLWEYNGWDNPIYMTAVSSNYATHMDFYGETPSTDSNLNANTNAYTKVFDSSGKNMYFGTGNWFYARITINKTSSANQATMVHEMGHAFGLAHYPSNNRSIMYPYSSGRKVSSPQKCDVDTINYLY